MKDTLDPALKLVTEMVLGVTARKLYGPDHPRAREASEKVATQIAELVSRWQGKAVTVLQVDGQLLVEGVPLTHLGQQAAAMARLMRRCMLERITMAHGISAQEASKLIEYLAAEDPSKELVLPHVEIGKLSVAEGYPGAGEYAGGAHPRALLRDSVAMLGEALRSVPPAANVVWDVAEQLDAAVQRVSDPLELLAELDSSDRWLEVHSHNTAAITAVLARMLGLAQPKRVELVFSAAVHDIGKARLDPEELAKELETPTGPLELYPDHPVWGLEAIAGVADIPQLAGVVIFEHHLKPDGTGWPRLSKPRKPHPAARLVAAADVLDLLHTVRGMSGSMTREAILATLQEMTGSLLDPFFGELVQVLWQSTIAL